jgi:hypothetical protein
VTSFFVSALIGFGVRPSAALALHEIFARPRGLIVFGGVAGSGAASLAELACDELGKPVAFRGELVVPDLAGRALDGATRGLVVGVVTGAGVGGGPGAVRARLLALGATEDAITAAEVAVVTQAQIAATGVLILEVHAADGRRLTGSLRDEAEAMIADGAITAEQAAAALGPTPSPA